MIASYCELPELTLLINRSQKGDPGAQEKLFELLYPHMKNWAGQVLSRYRQMSDSRDQDLVHDVFLNRLQGYHEQVNNRQHFLAVVTRALKNELLDQARRVRAIKRTQPGRWSSEAAARSLSYEQIMTLEQAVECLAKKDRRAAHIVRLRYYGGCSWQETAAAVGITVKVARTDWDFACKWLGDRLAG